MLILNLNEVRRMRIKLACLLLAACAAVGSAQDDKNKK